jgi:hypothetical protein
MINHASLPASRISERKNNCLDGLCGIIFPDRFSRVEGEESKKMIAIVNEIPAVSLFQKLLQHSLAL